MITCKFKLGGSPPEATRFWFISDTHLSTTNAKTNFETAIADIESLSPFPSLMACIGDLVDDYGNADEFDDYNEAEATSSIVKKEHLAGNHDGDGIDYSVYKDKIDSRTYYTQTVGNVLLIFMSDENSDTDGDISDTVFNWWKTQVSENQDKIIFVFTHQPLYDTVGTTCGHDWCDSTFTYITNSSRFTDLIGTEGYRVDIWFCGHNHRITYNCAEQSDAVIKNGCVFVNCVALTTHNHPNSESRVVDLWDGSTTCVIRLRDHSCSPDGCWLTDYEHEITLAVAFAE